MVSKTHNIFIFLVKKVAVTYISTTKSLMNFKRLCKILMALEILKTYNFDFNGFTS